jgi:hypothetical protein
MPYRWIENDEIDGPLQVVGIFLVQIKVNNTIISGSQMRNHCKKKVVIVYF